MGRDHLLDLGKWEDNIKVVLIEMAYKVMDQNHLTGNRFQI
jgi:hypothetical protein